MKTILIAIHSILLLIFTHSITYGQNIDLLPRYHSGKFSGMAGTGIGADEDGQTFDLNPAIFSINNNIAATVSQSFKYYDYSLMNRNVGNWTNKFKWGKPTFCFDRITFYIPLKGKLSLNAGYLNKMSPYLFNKRRAITGSTLFTHYLTGNIYAYTFSAAFRINDNTSFGITFYKYDGELNSEVRGANHGRDSDKYATLDNDCSGFNFRFGGRRKLDKLIVGFAMETPFEINFKSSKAVSVDNQYRVLLPEEDNSVYKMPFSLGFGLIYTCGNNWEFGFDYEKKFYEKSEIQPALYNMLNDPTWKDINIFRTGLKITHIKDFRIPLKIGYSFTPQLFSSNDLTLTANDYSITKDRGQIIKHGLTIGSTFNYGNLTLNATFEHTCLQWSQNVETNLKVENEYKEKTYLVQLELVYGL